MVGIYIGHHDIIFSILLGCESEQATIISAMEVNYESCDSGMEDRLETEVVFEVSVSNFGLILAVVLLNIVFGLLCLM